ncbi:MAG: c-type cytochrome [Akkermansiaceae bacterium]
MKSLPFAALLCLGTLSTQAAPSWIWSSNKPKDNDHVSFQKAFQIPAGGVSIAKLTFTCDNGATAFLNGKKIIVNKDWKQATSIDITDDLKIGENILKFDAKNAEGAAGFIATLSIKDKNGKTTAIESGKDWQALPANANIWVPATEIAKYGQGPWGNALNSSPAAPVKPVSTEVVTLPDFKAELLYTVPKGQQGSWVAMTVDPQGRLITGDQYGGLYRVTVDQPETKVEKLNTKVQGAHGLCYVYDALYLLKNEQKGARGLYRLRDTNNDGQFDEEKLLREFTGGGEHGLHSIIPSPDGKSLHLIFGNHTNEPKELDRSRAARVWSEDHLLPRMWDGNGHAKGKLAPGGFILKTDPDAKEIEMISYGFRNQFDAAFDQNGELFTYDADMEWDLGSPWYRPTRVYHSVSGLDAGWRSGTGKWPNHYPDTLPPAADIGPGSPTGVVMGTGAKFPAKYQHALYINDWTYGTMYAVHLSPDGAGFKSTVEEFVSGRPLPLTDVIIHPKDGNMYFMVGGRRTQSALYRVSYTGSESTAPAPAPRVHRDAKIRHQLEALHKEELSVEELNFVIEKLGHPDRYVRYAARVALEKHMETKNWTSSKLAASLTPDNPWAIIETSVALARIDKKSHPGTHLKLLGNLDPKSLDRDQLLGWLRAHSLVFTRLGTPEKPEDLIKRFRPLYPSGDNMIDRDLTELLIYLGDPKVVPTALQLMATAKDDHTELTNEGVLARNDRYAKAARATHSSRPNLQQYSLLFLLRNAKAGWTPELRKTYFSWFPRANKWQGGNSLKKFIENIRKEALANIAPENEKAQLDELSKTPPAAAANVAPAKGPGRAWTVKGSVTELEKRKTGRNFNRGKELYQAAACASCHQMAGEGGGIGPDLTGSGNRYTLADLMENIIDPSKVISDQYGSETITKKDGSTVIGRLGSENDKAISIMTNPFAPESLIEIPLKDIKSREPLPVSMMPPGLVNTMNPDELADLVAYLMSGGNPEHPAFK